MWLLLMQVLKILLLFPFVSSISKTVRNQRDFCPFKNNFVFINKSFFVSGKGDLVGCDITKHWEGAAAHDDVVVKSSADVRALTYCDIKRIHIPGLVDVLKLYPEFQERFAEEVCHDLTYNLREGYDADVSFILDFFY